MWPFKKPKKISQPSLMEVIAPGLLMIIGDAAQKEFENIEGLQEILEEKNCTLSCDIKENEIRLFLVSRGLKND